MCTFALCIWFVNLTKFFSFIYLLVVFLWCCTNVRTKAFLSRLNCHYKELCFVCAISNRTGKVNTGKTDVNWCGTLHYTIISFECERIFFLSTYQRKKIHRRSVKTNDMNKIKRKIGAIITSIWATSFLFVFLPCAPNERSKTLIFKYMYIKAFGAATSCELEKLI